MAVRLLLAFTGLLIGSPYSLITFAREVRDVTLMSSAMAFAVPHKGGYAVDMTVLHGGGPWC